MAEVESDNESVDSTDSEFSEGELEYVYQRSRGRTRKEDSWKRRYRKRMRRAGHRSPDSDERRSLTPYSVKIPKGKKYKKNKKKTKQNNGSQGQSAKSLSVHGSDSGKGTTAAS